MNKPEDVIYNPSKAEQEVDNSDQLSDTKIQLEIPHYSQLDSKLGISPQEARSVCAIVCMKSVLEYELHDTKHTATSFEAIKRDVETHGGKHELGGWRHDAMIAAIRDRGVVSWRRNWLAPNQDPTYFAEHEGYDGVQMAAVSGQIRNESLLSDDRRTREHNSIVSSLTHRHPVIVSVKAGFSDNAEDHLVLINGYQVIAGEEFFFVTDPIQRDSAHQAEAVSADFFFDHFNERAIFVAGQSPLA